MVIETQEEAQRMCRFGRKEASRQWTRNRSKQWYCVVIMPHPHRVEALSDDACLTSVCRVHRA